MRVEGLTANEEVLMVASLDFSDDRSRFCCVAIFDSSV